MGIDPPWDAMDTLLLLCLIFGAIAASLGIWGLSVVYRYGKGR